MNYYFKDLCLTSANVRRCSFVFLLLLVIIRITIYEGDNTRTHLRQKNYNFNLRRLRLRNVTETLEIAKKYITQRMATRRALADKHICIRFDNDSKTRNGAFPYVWTEPNTPFEDVTLVTFMSVGKFKVLDMVLKQWSGPISISIYVDDTSAENLLPELKKRPHFLDRRGVELSIIPGGFEFFPSDWTRQVALDQARTSHVMLFDIDLIFSQSLYKNLLSIKKEFTNKQKVLVIPTFELAQHVDVFTFPRDKSEVVDYYQRKVLRIFHQEFPPAYGPTDLGKWMHASSMYKVEYVKQFEPYIFAEKKILPSYPINLQGAKYDKSEYICRVNFTCEFHVSYTDFCIHYPHSRKKSSSYQQCAYKYIPCLGKDNVVTFVSNTSYKPSTALESTWIM